ncbi:MAG: ATP-dependent Clp protease adaptor ClpS [Thermodesulfobacteriota bacterium]
MYFDSERENRPNIDVIEIQEEKTEITPRYNVVLIDDNDHTYDYVIEMLNELFGHSKKTAFELACEVDIAGRVIVYTTSKEEAEIKKNQILSYGADWRLERSKGSMSAVVEEAQ